MWPKGTLLGALILVAVGSLAATGCGGDSSGLKISIDPTSGAPGTEISIDASGCDREPSGGLEDAAGGEIATARFTSAEAGTIAVPEDAEAGTYSVQVVCGQNPRETEKGLETDLVLGRATFEVTGASSQATASKKKLSVGDVVAIDGVEYQVLSVKTARRLPLELAVREGVRPGAAARGVYVVVRVKLRGAKRKDVGEDLVDGNGKVSVADGLSFLETPEFTELTIAFDVPREAVAGSELRVRLGRSTRTIDLGLS